MGDEQGRRRVERADHGDNGQLAILPRELEEAVGESIKGACPDGEETGVGAPLPHATA